MPCRGFLFPDDDKSLSDVDIEDDFRSYGYLLLWLLEKARMEEGEGEYGFR